jgi:hypothetical protein
MAGRKVLIKFFLSGFVELLLFIELLRTGGAFWVDYER